MAGIKGVYKLLKQMIGPLDQNDIFISTSADKVTWKELDERLDEKVAILQEHGLSSHVAFIIQENNKITIDDLLWILASIKNGGSASNAEDTASQVELDYLIQGSNANCVIRSNKIEIVKDPSLGSTKMHANEIFRGMTSGTTTKEMFEIYPYFWTYDDHMRSEVDGKTLLGPTIESDNTILLNIAPEFRKDLRPVMLQPSGFTSTYSPYNVLKAYQIGARLHHLNIGDDIIKEIDKVKPNCILSFPNGLKRIIDALPEDRKFDINYIESGGGYTPESLIRDIERKCNLKKMFNMAGSTEADCIMHSQFSPGDPLDNFYGMELLENAHYDIKVEDGLLWYKYGTLDWRTDNDKFIVKDGKYFYNGRANDEFLIVKQGVKVYTGVVEAVALEVDGVEYVSSCEKDKIHYLIYTGDADINKVSEKINEMQRFKRPHDIYHVTEDLYYSGSKKIQKRKLPSIVQSATQGIIAHLNIKDHELI